MTKEQFITAVEAKPNFIKWALVPALAETIGDIEKWRGVAYISTPDGTNTFNVWFIVDTETGEATWQNVDTLEPDKNTSAAKEKAFANYLASTFVAYFVNRSDLVNNWAEADVYEVSGQDLAKSTVLVFKQGSNPITHRKII
jgi:hypothetical protein